MADQEYEAPTTEQLANFMVVYADQIVDLQGMNLQLDPTIIQRLLESNPVYHAAALKHHRRFVEEAQAQFKKMSEGQLQCDYIRPNGRRCPNWNQPGSFFCGLHQEED